MLQGGLMNEGQAAEKVRALAQELFDNGHPVASIVLFTLVGAMLLGGNYMEEFGNIAGDVARVQLARSKIERRNRLN
jgi:hypothetical protein